MEDRSQRDNLRIDSLKEVENESWKQTGQILKNMIQRKLAVEYVKKHDSKKTSSWICEYWKNSQGR